MLEDDLHPAGTDGLCRLDEFALLDGDGLTPDEPGVPGPPGQSDGKDCVVQAAAHDGHHGDGEEQGREAEEHVGNAHDEVIHPATEAAGDGTQGNADDKRQANGGQCRGPCPSGAPNWEPGA